MPPGPRKPERSSARYDADTMRHLLHFCATCASCAVLWCAPHAALAQDAANEKIAFKLTPSYYLTQGAGSAWDVNLRGSKGAHTAWLGIYRDSTGFQQARTGYEYRSDFGWARSLLSLQAAAGGFRGWAVTAELGQENYAIVGWGRTNLRSYYNLNFDPNDAITLGFGSRALPKTELSLFHIWDDRLPTQQHVTHAVLRYKATDAERWTADLSAKRGLSSSSGALVSGKALSVTYDFGDYFARLARDQYVNFSDATQTRVSMGMRF